MPHWTVPRRTMPRRHVALRKLPRARLFSAAVQPCLLGLACVLLLAVGAADAGELSEAAWKDIGKTSRKLMKETGKRPQKQAAIEIIGEDDSRRAAELLVDWALKSLRMDQKEIADEIAETKKPFERLDAQLRKDYGRAHEREQKKLPAKERKPFKWPPRKWRDVKHSLSWKGLKKQYDAALAKREVELGVRFSISEAIRRMASQEAVAYFVEEGLPALQMADLTEPVQVAIARCLLNQDKARALPFALRVSGDANRVKLRILALDWMGQHQIAEGFPRLVAALGAKEMAVRRTAVLAMQGLNDTRCVKPLIDAMPKADAQLLYEIDQVLHWYTGESFEASASVWKRWWANEGARWLADSDASRARHGQRGEPKHGGTAVEFYGIPTESHHVVFVLDRSGSMKTKAGEQSQKRKRDKPKGPVTGPGRADKDKDGSDPTAIEGDTKMEVAINQLKKSVQQLDKKVNFSIVFYSDNVTVWKEPPELMGSTPKNKEDAISWFEKLDAEGSTQLFAALEKALEYADTVGEDIKKQRTGADTIFLLSDGSPTHKNQAKARALSPEEIEAAWSRFKEKNKLYHCVVHTIGIGPQHNRSLMRRIAKETGGQYKAVGAQ